MLVFVGGSRATGTAGGSSDIDVFVVIFAGDRAREEEFARELRNMHLNARFDFDHYGEIFSYRTLIDLLDFTEALIAASPAVAESACYRGNCLLSIFRKGQVVFGFLHDQKIHVRDYCGILKPLELRSQRYFKRSGIRRSRPEDAVLLPHGSERQRLAGNWREGMETPIGIGLERWFGDDLAERLNRLKVAPDDIEMTPRRLECPLRTQPPPVWNIHAAQCLGNPLFTSADADPART